MSNVQKLNGGQIIAHFLHNLGVKHVYGVPGGQPLAITDAIYDIEGMDFVTTRHESGAASMADGYARLSGKIGVCLATTGPGATNLLTGVGGAYRDSSPVLVLTANNKLGDIGRDDAQDADHVALFEKLTKWSVFVDSIKHLPSILRQAYVTMYSGCPGPVHIDVARDVLEEQTMNVNIEELNVQLPAQGMPDEETLQRIARMIAQSEKPLIWAGNGVKISRAGKEVLKLAEQCSIPVINTFNGIGSVPFDHANSFGTLSRMGTSLAKELLEDSDLLVAVGNSLNGVSTKRWTFALPDQLIQIDTDPTNINKHYPVNIGLVSDAKTAVNGLFKYIEQELDSTLQQSREKRLEYWRKKKTEWLNKTFAYGTEQPLKPQTVIQALGQHADPDTVWVFDAGNPGIWSHLLNIKEDQAYMKCVGFGNMGFSVPAAIGAKMADQNRPIVAVVGDGSLGMSLGELSTIVAQKLPITVIVMNDQAYGNIKQEELWHFGAPRYIAVDLEDIQFADVAKACGGDGERVRTYEELIQALEKAKKSESLYVIDIIIDGEVSVWEKLF